MRKRILLGSAVVIIVLIIVSVALFARAPSNPVQQSAPEELPPEEIPPYLLVVPEVPLGTLSIILAFFLALIIIHMKPKAKLR